MIRFFEILLLATSGVVIFGCYARKLLARGASQVSSELPPDSSDKKRLEQNAKRLQSSKPSFFALTIVTGIWAGISVAELWLLPAPESLLTPQILVGFALFWCVSEICLPRKSRIEEE